MLRSILLSATLCSFLSLAGCAVATDESPEEVAETAQAVHRKASYGEKCGGFMLNATQCGTGLACSHIDEHGHFIHPDMPGVCLQAKGTHCGGFVVHPHACAEGHTCKPSLPHPDLAGTCQ